MNKQHPTISASRILAAVEESMYGLGSAGFCQACGFEQEGCEPDMEKGKCESCGENEVTGAENLLF